MADNLLGRDMRRLMLIVSWIWSSLLCASSHGQTPESDLLNDAELEVAARSSAQSSAWLDKVNSIAPPDMARAALWEFYRDKDTAANRIGDTQAQLEIAQKWLDASGDDPRLRHGPLLRLWRLNMHSGDITAGLNYGQALMTIMPEGPEKVRMLAFLAGDYIQQMLLARGAQFLAQAQNAFNASSMRRPQSPNQKYQLLRAKVLLLSRRNWLLRRQGKFSEAEMVGHQEIAVAEKAANATTGLGEHMRESRHVLRTGALGDVMRVQIDQGKLTEAAATAQVLLNYVHQHNIFGNKINQIYRLIVDLKLAQNDLRRALYYARASLGNAQGGDAVGTTTGGMNVIFSYGQLIAVLMAKRDWGAALLIQNQLDVRAAGNEMSKRLALRPLHRGALLAYTGNPREAQALLMQVANNVRERLGTRHVNFAIASGLYAIALAKAGQKDAARAVFSAAVHDMHLPEVMMSGATEHGLLRTYRQLILEEYLALLTESPADDAAVDEAFRVAEQIRNSVVQRSIVASAVRAAASVVGLGGLVRDEQDASNEVASLQSFLFQQLDEMPQRQLAGVIEDMRKRIGYLQSARAALQRDIKQGFPKYDALIYPQPPTVAMMMDHLGHDEAFISILPTATQVTILAVSSRRASVAVAKLSLAQVDALVARLRSTLDIGEGPSDRAPAFDGDAAYQLYRLLLEPVADVWAGKAGLVIAAGGSLGQIPFAALLSEPIAANAVIDDMALRKAAWLVRQASIVHAPSVSSWILLRDLRASSSQKNDIRNTRTSFYGLGDPLFSPAQPAAAAESMRNVSIVRSGGGDADLVSFAQYNRLPPLPETREEIRSIAGALGADPQHDVLFGKEASRKNVLSADLSQRQVIVFATHGLVAGDLPNLSQPALALAATDDNKENPLLTLEDVLRLKLNADWVVLSACNTAAADGQGSEAVSGLGRGFFYAGAKALLVTHWAVETNSAKLLTSATFRHYAGNPALTRAQALRQAQLDMIGSQKHAHPFFWSSYALIGDGGR